VRDLLWGPAAHERDAARRTTQTVQRWTCDDRSVNGCLHPTIVAVTDLVGFAQYTSRILLGDPAQAGAVGLVEKFRWGNVALTGPEKAFMELAPHGLGAMLHNLGQYDTGMARDFAEKAAPVIALEMTKLLLDDLIGQAAQATALHQNPYAKQVIAQIQGAKADVAQQYGEIAQRYGNLQTLMTHYGSLAPLVKGRPLQADTADAGAEAGQ
jgi:conjugative transfer pilus assembly protein TraH